MVTQQHVDTLRSKMQSLRGDLVHLRRLREDDIWPLVDESSTLLDEARGGKFEDALGIIHSLLSSIWITVREQERMHHAHALMQDQIDKME